MTTITLLPDPPTRADPSNFNSKADSFLSALPTFGTEANTVASEVNTNASTASSAATTATTQAGIATTQATNASTSATNASNSATAAATSATNASNSATAAATSATNASNYAAALNATSTSSILIGTGSKTFTTQLGKQFIAGNPIYILDAYNPSNYMYGIITSYSSTTLIVNVTNISGSGTIADWKIGATGLIGPQGIQGVPGEVTLNGTETLTNKTLTAPILTNATGSTSGITLNDGYTEEVFAVTGTTPALSPTNGSIQTWTLSGNSTPTAGTWAGGQSITLMVDDDTAYTVTWTSLAVTWKTDGGSAPTLNTTGFTAIQLWKVGTTIYGARVGDA